MTAFAMITEELERAIAFNLPPASSKIYNWLLRRYPAGVEQEFDKTDFDDYCFNQGRKPFCRGWFTSALKHLVKIGLVKIQRQYKGMGYKVTAFHPRNFCEPNEQKNEQTVHKSEPIEQKNEQKRAANPHSSVLPSIYNRDIQREAKQEVACKKKESGEEKQPTAKCDQDIDLSSQRDNISCFSVQKKDLAEEKSSASCSTSSYRKIINDQWRSQLEELDSIGVSVNSTIEWTIKTKKASEVREAIALYLERKRDGYIDNPAAYFEHLILRVVGKANAENQEDQKALFRRWYDLAREKGCCSGYEEKDGVLWVKMNGTFETWKEAVDRGWTIEYLRKKR